MREDYWRLCCGLLLDWLWMRCLSLTSFSFWPCYPPALSLFGVSSGVRHPVATPCHHLWLSN
jgi:hypothetical protein